MSGAPTLVKTPYVKTVFKTDKELQDFIKCCDPNTGYLHFMDNFFMIQHPTKGSMVYHPWPYQKRLIETYHNYRFSISLMPRQSGKCFGINTLVKLKNTTTDVVEEITIGEFHDRISKMYDLQCRNERTALTSFSQAQNESNGLQKYISGFTNKMREFIETKFFKFFGRKEPWLSAWWKNVTVLGKFYIWRQENTNSIESRSNQDKKPISCNQDRLLAEKNQRRYGKGFAIINRKTNDFLIEEMYREIWGTTRSRKVEIETTKMDKKFQEAKFFNCLPNAIQQNNGTIPFNSCILRHSFPSGHGRICKQGISSGFNNWEKHITGLYRFRKEENNRIRRDLLAWAINGESTTRKRTRRSDNSKWISTDESSGRRLCKKPIRSNKKVSELSDIVERKFINSYKLENYEIFTDTGWEKITDLHLTVPYVVYRVETVSGLKLECADTHILFDQDMHQIFAKDLSIGSLIQTTNGIEQISHLEKTNKKENMYDVTVDSENHRFFSNGILSHNSTSAAGYLLWYAMFVPDSTILIAAHKYTGAQEIMQRIRYAYEACPDHIKAGVVTYNKGSLDFENGSRIVSATTTENTGRGMSISLLYLDEFAFVRPSIAELFWTSITPTLSTGGKAIITSTPNSDEDQFALIWKQANKTEDAYGNQTELGVNGFRAYKAHWKEQPGRDDKWAEEMKAQLGEDRFRREIGCEFIIADETLIAPTTLIDLEGIEPISRLGQVRWYKKPEKGNIYTVALDPSLGTGGDPAAIQIFEANTTIQIGEWKHNKTDIPNQIKLIAQINKYIEECTGEPDNIYYSVENNSIGEAALISLNEYGETNIPGIFLSETGKKRKGFNTTHKVKLAACAKLKTLIESKKLVVNSKSLVTELKTFVALGGSYEAKVGETDDLVMASLLTVRMIQHLSDYHVDLEEQIRDHDESLAPLPFFAVLG